MIWLWVGVLALAFLLLHLGRFWLNVRAGRQLSQHAQRYEQHPANPTTRLLIAGDSVAFGVGASSPATSVAGLFGQADPSADIINVGVSGAHTNDLANQLNGVRGQQFDAVILIVGANDIIHRDDLRTSGEALDQALTITNQLSPQILVMPEGNIGNAPIFPTWFAAWLTGRSRQLRQEFMMVTDKHDAVFVDVFQERRDSTWRKNIKHFYAADKFHPGDGGNADWFRILNQALNTGQTPGALTPP